MGYQITFLPTEEKMQGYKPYNELSKVELEPTKYEIMSYCMKKHNESVFSKVKYLKNTLTFLANQVEQYEKQNAYYRWKSDENHWLWYCGWEFARECQFDKDDVIERHVKDLLVLSDIVETPDYFENSENFYKKLEEVDENIDGFVEIMSDYYIHEIIKDLDDFKLNDDDEDENESCLCSDDETSECLDTDKSDNENDLQPCPDQETQEYLDADEPDNENTSEDLTDDDDDLCENDCVLYLNTSKLYDDAKHDPEKLTNYNAIIDSLRDQELIFDEIDGENSFIEIFDDNYKNVLEIMKNFGIDEPEKYFSKVM